MPNGYQCHTLFARIIRTLLIPLFLLLTGSVLASESAVISVEAGGHVRASLPTTQQTAAYFTLRNHGDQSLQLLAVVCQHPAVAHCNLHQTHYHGDHVAMRAASTINIQSHGLLALTPGGLHLMLEGLSQPLNAGDSVAIQLTFNNGQELSFELAVEPITP